MSTLAWVLAGAGVTLAALAVWRWRRAGRVLAAILRDEDPR